MTRPLAAIVFDFDGVIADSERLHLAAYQRVLAPLGLELSDEAYYSRYLGYDDLGVFRRYARDAELAWDDGTIRRLTAEKGARFEELASRGEMLFEGAAEFIRTAHAAVPTAIASGALTHEIEDVLERAGLRDRFLTIVGADQCARTKPSPDPYLEAVHRLRVAGHELDASRTVAIEDSVWGLVSARTAGLRTVAVANTYARDELTAHAELVVAGLHALTLDALDRLCESAPIHPDLARGAQSR
jgi:HAD superfamily hydrolase (TIGR01509 family)